MLLSPTKYWEMRGGGGGGGGRGDLMGVALVANGTH